MYLFGVCLLLCVCPNSRAVHYLSDIIIGASLTLIMIMAPTHGIMESTCLSVFIYASFTSQLSHPGSWNPCMPWNASCILVYWHVHLHDLQLHTWLNNKDDWGYSCLPWRLSTKTGRWMRSHTWYKPQIQPTETVTYACVSQKWLIGCWTILLFYDVHRRDTELATVPAFY